MTDEQIGPGTHLPVPSVARTGLITYDAKDPGTSYPPIEQLRPPDGAPNVVVILLDDAGFGASSAFGGPCQTPAVERLAATRDEDVFADADRFGILQPEAHQYLSLGAGPHFCIGHGLTRLQLRTLLTELFTARPHVAVRGLARQYRSSWLNALTEIPVDFHAAAVIAQ
jgi:hypothetical protein